MNTALELAEFYPGTLNEYLCIKKCENIKEKENKMSSRKQEKTFLYIYIYKCVFTNRIIIIVQSFTCFIKKQLSNIKTFDSCNIK